MTASTTTTQKIKIAVVMITIDRSPKGNHLADSILWLTKSGLFEHPNFDFTLIHSGDNVLNLEEALAVYPKLKIVKMERLYKFNEALTNGIKIALKNRPDVVLFLEDDVRVCADFPRYVFDTIEQAGGAGSMLDFITYYREVTNGYFQGKQFIEMDARGFYGTSCFAMDAFFAESYANYVIEKTPAQEDSCDIWVEDWLLSHQWEPVIKCAVPSGVQHTGKNSYIGHDFIEAPCFKDDVEQTKPKKSPHFSQSASDGDSFIIKNTNTNTELSLNSSAHLLYLFCDGKHTFKQIINNIYAELGGNKYTLDAEIRQGLFSLKCQELIIY